jgi:hypothetical protein
VTITRDDAIRSATRFVESRDWRAWWSLKRLAAQELKHPESGRFCWCVQSLPGATDVPITTVWVDRETGDPIAASRVSRTEHEEWPT